jgi:hypothetical protein
VAELVAWLAGPEATQVSGQLFGVRGREVFLFSQPRPVARIKSPGVDGLGAAIAEGLAPHYLDLGTDLEAFGGEPIL